MHRAPYMRGGYHGGMPPMHNQNNSHMMPHQPPMHRPHGPMPQQSNTMPYKGSKYYPNLSEVEK